MSLIAPGAVISTILRHDAKVTSYKIALLRAINDVVLAFPDLRTYHQDVAVPLAKLAEYWMAYYWSFVHPQQPIQQGQRSRRGETVQNDMAFRPALADFRARWESLSGGASRPSDGFLVIHELRISRKRALYPAVLLTAYHQTIATICKTLEMPIRYAGPGHWSIFDKPVAYAQLQHRAIAIPGTQLQDKCLVIRAELWQTFRDLSLWVEALCIHEWCLFTERVEQPSGPPIDRGQIYVLLTDRPDNRRPLTWERNHIELLLMEGIQFICPWTERRISEGIPYDLDHLVPLAVYPTNELWNLVPADPTFNSCTKRDRLPTSARLQQARPYLELAYCHYGCSTALAQALREDAALRFATFRLQDGFSPPLLATAVVDLIEQVADSRNLARF